MPGQYFRDPVSGERVFARDGKVFLKDGAGNLVRVDYDAVGQKILSGERVAATAEDVANRDEERRQQEVAGGPVRAVAEGAAAGFFDAAGAVPRAVAAAGSMLAGAEDIDPLGKVLGGRQVLQNAAQIFGELTQDEQTGEAYAREYAETARATAKEHPIASGAGRVAGELAGSGLLFGASSKAAAALQTSGRSLALARATQGAIEGAPLGLTQAGENAYLEDTKLSSQEAIAAMGLGAILGGVTGLGFGAVESRVARRALAGVEERSALKVTDKDISATAERVLKEKPGKGVVDTIRQHIKEGLDKADVYVRRGEILDTASREVTERLDDVAAKSRPIMDESRFPTLKRSNVAARISGEPKVAISAARDQAAALQSVGRVLKDSRDMGNNALRKRVSQYLEEVGDAVHVTDDPAEAFIKLDQGKRALQKWTKTLRQTSSRSQDALKAEQGKALAQELDTAGEKVREFLMREDIWGGAGADQRAINQAWEKFLESNRVFNQKFLYRTGNVDYQSGIPEFIVDSGKTHSFVQGIGRPGNKISEDYLRSHLDATEGLTRAIDDAYGLGGQAKEIAQAVDAIRSTLNKADDTVKVANQIDELLKADVSTGLLGSPFGAGAAGGVIGGPLGAAAGVAYSLVSRPGQAMRHAIAVQQLRRNLNQRVNQGVDGFFGRFSGIDVLSRAAGSAAKTVKSTGKALKVAAVPASLAAFVGSHENKRDAYKARAEEIRTATADHGQKIRQSTPQQLGRLPETMPEFSRHFVDTVTRGAEFLKTKLPAQVAGRGFVPSYRKELPPSELEIMKFARYWSAVNDPVSVLEDLGNGMATHEQIEALGAVYPDLLEQIRNTVREKLVELDVAGTPISHVGRLQLDLLLGLDGAGEPTFSSDFILRLDEYRAAQAERQPQPKQQNKAPDVASRMQTGTDAITQLARSMAS